MTRALIGMLTFGAALACAAPAAAQTVHLAVIVGLAGDPEHAELFQRWASTLVDGATERLGMTRDHVIYLAEQPEKDPTRATGKSTQQDIERAFAAMAKNAKADDVVFIVLIGHGTFDGKVAKFNLPGPDIHQRSCGTRPGCEGRSARARSPAAVEGALGG